MTDAELFALGKVLFEARIREAWGAQADHRISLIPWPRHIGAERAAEHDLAMAQARAADRWMKERTA